MQDEPDRDDQMAALDRAIAANRQFEQDARDGLRYPPEASRQAAEVISAFSATMSEIWMKAQRFDSPDTLVTDDGPGLPDGMNDIILKAIEWADSAAMGYAIAAGDGDDTTPADPPHTDCEGKDSSGPNDADTEKA